MNILSLHPIVSNHLSKLTIHHQGFRNWQICMTCIHPIRLARHQTLPSLLQAKIRFHSVIVGTLSAGIRWSARRRHCLSAHFGEFAIEPVQLRIRSDDVWEGLHSVCCCLKCLCRIILPTLNTLQGWPLRRLLINVSISCWADHGWIRTSRCHLLQSLRIMWMSFNLYQGYWQEG